MKKLSDYKGDEAIELWADMLDPLTDILADDTVQKAVRGGKSKLDIVKTILKTHKKEAVKLMLLVDPEPIDGINVVIRLAELVTDIGKYPEVKSFFGYAEQEQTDGGSGGSPTETTGAKEK